MNILVINGANMSKLDRRGAEYGNNSIDDIYSSIETYAAKNKISVEFLTSDSEGEIVSKINTYNGDGIVINPAAYSHYSIAILDALLIFGGKKVEVHLTNLYKREDVRQRSITARGCDGIISGLGIYGYILAIEYISSSTKK